MGHEPNAQKIQEETILFGEMFTEYVDDLVEMYSVVGLRAIIDMMRPQISTFGLETIRQRLLYGKIDVDTLPKYAGVKDD